MRHCCVNCRACNARAAVTDPAPCLSSAEQLHTPQQLIKSSWWERKVVCVWVCVSVQLAHSVLSVCMHVCLHNCSCEYFMFFVNGNGGALNLENSMLIMLLFWRENQFAFHSRTNCSLPISWTQPWCVFNRMLSHQHFPVEMWWLGFPISLVFT